MRSPLARLRTVRALPRIAGVLAALVFPFGTTVGTAAAPVGTAGADVNAGAALAQANGCAGCHGAAYGGGIGPKLVGIEHRRSAAAIAAAIAKPTAPMPTFPFTAAQIADIVAYLSTLDGSALRPTATLHFTGPQTALLTVRFMHPPPNPVVALPSMGMSDGTMTGAPVTLAPASDRRVWRGTVRFSMSGAWTIDVAYGTHHITVPVNVGGSP